MPIRRRPVSAPVAVLCAATCLLIATSASAYRVEMILPPLWTPISPGDLVSIPIYLDTEGGSDIALLGFGVLFDESVYTYRQDLSSVTSYLLYTGAKPPYLIPDPSCGGYPSTGACGIYPTRSNQVQIGFLSNKLPLGVPGSGRELLTTLVFEAVAPGVGSFAFDFDPFYGSILQLGDTTNPPLGLGYVYTPEPGTALLLGLGLMGLGWARRRTARPDPLA